MGRKEGCWSEQAQPRRGITVEIHSGLAEVMDHHTMAWRRRMTRSALFVLLCCAVSQRRNSADALLRQSGVELLVDLLPSFADEVHDPKYIVAVDLDGGAESATEPADGFLTMTDRTGRRFRCALPANGSGGGAERADDDEGQVVGGDRRPSELLEALDGLCFYRVEDWWTYELCYKKAVRQFHKEGEALTAEFQLGAYDAAASGLDEVRHDAAAAPADATYVSQVYSGGEPCDVTGAPRRTEVRFSCGEAAGRDVLSGLREPATCRYLLHLATPRLCGHPAFRVAEPPVHAILCSPLPAGGQGRDAEGERSGAWQQGPAEGDAVEGTGGVNAEALAPPAPEGARSGAALEGAGAGEADAGAAARLGRAREEPVGEEERAEAAELGRRDGAPEEKELPLRHFGMDGEL